MNGGTTRQRRQHGRPVRGAFVCVCLSCYHEAEAEALHGLRFAVLGVLFQHQVRGLRATDSFVWKGRGKRRNTRRTGCPLARNVSSSRLAAAAAVAAAAAAAAAAATATVAATAAVAAAAAAAVAASVLLRLRPLALRPSRSSLRRREYACARRHPLRPDTATRLPLRLKMRRCHLFESLSLFLSLSFPVVDRAPEERGRCNCSDWFERWSRRLYLGAFFVLLGLIVLSDGLVKVQLLFGKVTLVGFVHRRGHCGDCWREFLAAVRERIILSVG